MFFYIGVSCIVADITNVEFCMHVFDLLLCDGQFPLSLLQYDNVQVIISHSRLFKGL